MHDDTEPAEVDPDLDWEPRGTHFSASLRETVDRARAATVYT